MNPYLKAIPNLPANFDPTQVFHSGIESSLKALIQQYNLLTYIDYAERLPDCAALRREMKQKGLDSSANVDVLLWVLGHTYEVLPIPVTPDEGSFKNMHFLANNKSIVETLMRSFSQDAGLLYHQLLGQVATMTALKQVSANPAYYSDMSNDHRRLFVVCRALVVTSDYRDLFHREPVLMRQDMIQERRHAALTVLQRLAARRAELNKGGSNDPVIAAEALRKTSEEPVEDSADPFSVITEVPADILEVPAPARTIALRAVDMPEWKAFEAGRKDSLNWEMVMRVFGSEMVIRILLRRQDYRQLLGMFEARFVSDPSDMRYCLRSMDKIVEHRDLLPAKEPDYNRLRSYLERILAN